jgi:hypothetical protein
MTHSDLALRSLRNGCACALSIYDGKIRPNNTLQAYLSARCHDAQTGGLIFCAADSKNIRGQV